MKKSSQHLRESLVDANLSLPLFILMAQQRDCIIYRDGASRHLKLVGKLFDNVKLIVIYMQTLLYHPQSLTALWCKLANLFVSWNMAGECSLLSTQVKGCMHCAQLCAGYQSRGICARLYAFFHMGIFTVSTLRK